MDRRQCCSHVLRMKSEGSGIIVSMTDSVLEDDVRSWDVGATCLRAALYKTIISSGPFHSSKLIEYFSLMARIINKTNLLVRRILRLRALALYCNTSQK